MMQLERYKKDLDSLLVKGEQLDDALMADCHPKEFEQFLSKDIGDKAEGFIESLPSFKKEYQSWYSEAKVLIRQLLPDRLSRSGVFRSLPRGHRGLPEP